MLEGGSLTFHSHTLLMYIGSSISLSKLTFLVIPHSYYALHVDFTETDWCSKGAWGIEKLKLVLALIHFDLGKPHKNS